MGKIVSKATVPAMTMANTFGLIREPFAGAWQRNIQVDTREAVLAFAAVYACVTRIAADIAKLRIKLVRFTDDRIWQEVAEQSPFWPVLRKPNAWQNRIQFLTDWMIMKLLYGNAYVLKERDSRGVVVALYVLDSRRVRPLVAANGDVYYQLQQDDLAGVRGSPAVPAMEIIHDRGPTLWHPLVGVSPIYACGASATQGNRIQANSAKFFENMSRPGGVLSVPGDVDEPTFERLKKEWNDFGGANAGRTAVMTNGMKYEAYAIAAQDAQLIEQLKWTVEDVARAFGMPLYKIGAGPVPTSNNVEALQQQYYSDCLQIQIESIELCLDEGLNLDNVDGKTLGTELDLDGLLRMDKAAQAEMLSKASGIMKLDELRHSLNLPPVTGGNAVYLQQQNFSSEALAKRDAQPDPFGTAPAPAPTPAPAPAATAPPPSDDEPAKAMRAAASDIEAATSAVRSLLAKVMAAQELHAAQPAPVPPPASAPAAETDAVEVAKFADALLAGLEAIDG